MTYVRAVDPPLSFETTGYVALADERRPARATGQWSDVWRRVEEPAAALDTAAPPSPGTNQ